MHRNTSFTLIELIVVIAVIGLLTSMLLPGLNKGRRKAKSVLCQSQFKQHGLSYRMYADDYDEYIASTIPGVAYDGREILEEYIESSSEEGREYLSRHFLCPQALTDQDTQAAATDVPWDSMMTSIFLSAAPIGGLTKPFSYNNFGDPYTIVHGVDSMNVRVTTFNFGGSNTAIDRHLNLVNVMFLDGHVESPDINDAYQEELVGAWTLQ